MRTILLPILLFVSSTIFAQDKMFTINGVGTIRTADADYSGYGLDLSAIRKINGGFYVGLNAGMMHFKYQENPYFPVALNMTYFPLKNRNANAPYITFQPGYGIYDSKRGFGVDEFDADGGFTYFAGIGMLTKTAGKTRANFSLGYSSFGSNFNYTTSMFNGSNVTHYYGRRNFGTITLKVGLTLQK